MTCGADVASFIEKKDNWVPLAVIGSADADRRLAKGVGSHDRHIFRHPESSALIIRGNKATQRSFIADVHLHVGGQHRIDESLSRLHVAVRFRQG